MFLRGIGGGSPELKVVAVLLYTFGLSLREARPLSPSGWALSDYARLEVECIRRAEWVGKVLGGGTRL